MLSGYGNTNNNTVNFKRYTNFSEWEFRCKCGCGKNNMTKHHMDMLAAARGEADIPFIITSGSRCEQHNADVGGAENSDHLIGEGTDIKCFDSRTRFKIVTALLNAGFTRIGIADTFIHAGSADDNPQQVIWLY